MISAVVRILTLFCLCFGGIYAGSSSSSYYTKPECAPNGFYCKGTPSTCLPRTQRCTTDDASDQCISKYYEYCDYDQGSGKFRITRYSSDLESLSFSSKRYELEHQFVTYRGLMYEFGDYGSRVQDPSDPNYEYTKRSYDDKTSFGLSSCTYEQVLPYLNYWNSSDYSLLSNNCQDFVRGLTNYLKSNCPTQKKRSNDEMAEYFFSISEGNCTTSDSGVSNNESVVRLPTVIIFSAIVTLGLKLYVNS